MGPKKKQQEIDLSTLPQCHSINSIILCRGKKSRAINILHRLQKQGEKFIGKIKKSQVLDHAKEKNIYVDPSTLNEKQKKDAKFMQSINTQLTAQVIGKAIKSLITTLNTKIRIEKKNNIDKQVEDKSGRKYDIMYSFEDFPQSKEQFEQFAKIHQNIKYVLVVDPKVSWNNAPELPEQQEEEQDEEIKEYKKLLKNEEKTGEDIQYQNNVDKRINQIRGFRSQSKQQSQFRNCTISIIDAEIDPYNEQNSLTELIKNIFENINRLNAEMKDYQQWKKDKQKQSLGQSVKVDHKTVEGKSISELLNNIALSFNESSSSVKQENDEDDIMNLINNFSLTSPKKSVNKSNKVKQNSKQKNKQIFVGGNDYFGQNSKLLQQIRHYIKFPGINRYLMPQIASKSEKLRKLHQSQYALFLGKNISLDEYFRRQQILLFEQYIKQFDEQRQYSFTDRIYQQHHNQDSLQRQLYRALQFHQYNVYTKYDENSDKLYLMLVYKNNARRVNRRLWQSNWKVIPNYQSWLKYFKNNQNNLSNTQYFDIDYQKIGNIQQNTRCFTLKNGVEGAVIINKQCLVSNIKQTLLYGIKKDYLFGIKDNKFYSQNGKIRIYHLKNKQNNNYETIILLPDSTIRLFGNGNVMIEKDGNKRIITPNGYTILYDNNKNIILHPNGSITYNQNTYINEDGFGLKDGHLFTSPTLKRRIQNGQIIKREDNTIIVNTLQQGILKSKWIQFYQGTEYQVQKNRIRIQKAGQPFITCQDQNIRILSNNLIIRLTNRRNTSYTINIQYADGNNLRIQQQNIYIFEIQQHQQIHININNNEINTKFNNQQLIINNNEAKYIKNNISYDARQDQDKYGQEDILPNDYIQPRLFIINNDNTGFQIINQSMYQSYLKTHQHTIDNIYQKKNQKYTEYHIISKQQKNQGKFINNQLLVNLDVFDNSKNQIDPPSHQYIRLKTFLKYEKLSPQNVNQIHKIKSDLETWRKNNSKQENEYGHKQHGDPATKAKIQAKLLTIKKRQEKQVRVKTEVLSQTAKNFHITAYEQVLKRLEKQNRQKQLRNQFMKKKNSVIQEYKRVNFHQQQKKNEQSQTQPVQQFMDHYFMTSQGRKALSEMPDWVFRPKEIKPPAQLDPEIKNQLNNTNNVNREEQSQDPRQRYDTVEVNLNPKRQKQIYIKPSVFTQREIDEQRYAFQHQKKAYKYHEAKRKDFNVYGQQRRSKPQVPTLLRTQPTSEINQKYLVTEAPLDKKVKTSSMRNKFTSSASSIVEMRKQGPHTLLMKTIDKGNDMNKLLEKRTMMVQADLNDKLQRDVLINPIEANFGALVENKTYQLKIDIKNQDVISQRINVKRPKSIYVKAQLSQMGPIAMGMTKKIIVRIKASTEILGKFTDEFDIVTKHQIYHIPVTAHIISENQSKNEGFLLNRRVSQVEENKKKKNESSFELPRIK